MPSSLSDPSTRTNTMFGRQAAQCPFLLKYPVVTQVCPSQGEDIIAARPFFISTVVSPITPLMFIIMSVSKGYTQVFSGLRITTCDGELFPEYAVTAIAAINIMDKTITGISRGFRKAFPFIVIMVMTFTGILNIMGR